MNTIKLKYKKDRKVFILDREINLPDNYKLEIRNHFLKEVAIITDIEIEESKRDLKEKFINDFKMKYGIDISGDPFLKLIGSEAKYLSMTTYEDDKKRIMDTVAEKYNGEYNG